MTGAATGGFAGAGAAGFFGATAGFCAGVAAEAGAFGGTWVATAAAGAGVAASGTEGVAGAGAVGVSAGKTGGRAIGSAREGMSSESGSGLRWGKEISETVATVAPEVAGAAAGPAGREVEPVSVEEAVGGAPAGRAAEAWVGGAADGAAPEAFPGSGEFGFAAGVWQPRARRQTSEQASQGRPGRDNDPAGLAVLRPLIVRS